MNIVQIGIYPQDFDNIKGGVEASIYGLSHELSKSNFVTVLDIPRNTIEKDYVEKDYNIDVLRFSSTGKKNYTANKRTNDYLNIIKEINPDICQI